jgi:hypothetical protein
MLIVITKDPYIVEFRPKQSAGEAEWGTIFILDPSKNQKQATAQLKSLLNNVAEGEPLAIVGHGNDTEAGGEGVDDDTWGWTAAEMAALLNTELRHRPGPILFEVCSDDPQEVSKPQVLGFATSLQLEISRLTVSKNVKGATVYSYNTHIDAHHTLPRPQAIHKSVELQPSILS